MIKICILLIIFPFAACKQKQELLPQDYSFLVSDGGIVKLHQSNDTLYELNCYVYKPCQTKPQKHYKIISSKRKKAFIVLKLEQLDAIPMRTDPHPPARYSVVVLKDVNRNKLGYLELISGMTKQGIDAFRIQTDSMADKFYFTYYSDDYLKELSTLPKVTTKSQVLEIVKAAKSRQFKVLAERYVKSNPPDMYTAGLSAEILNSACIEEGYNPIGAGLMINKLMR